MFIHYLKYKMPYEFTELIKEFHEKINKMDVVINSLWTTNYSKYVILFEGQTKGHHEKFQTPKDINKLLNGFLEMYANILPEIKITDMIIKHYDDKKEICLILSSRVIFEMRYLLCETYGYYLVNDQIVKRFKTENGRADEIVIENINIEFPIISDIHLKKNVNLLSIYMRLFEILNDHKILNKEIEPINFIFDTEHKRAKKIILW